MAKFPRICLCCLCQQLWADWSPLFHTRGGRRVGTSRGQTGTAVTCSLCSMGCTSTEPGTHISASGAQEEPSRECWGDGCREQDGLAKLNSSAQLKKIPQRSVSPVLGVSAQTQASPFPFPGNIMSRGCSQPVPGSGVRATPRRQGLFWLPLPGCPCMLCRCVRPHDSRYRPTPASEGRGSELQGRASLVTKWLRVRLPMQGTRVRALGWEDPTCRGAAGPVSHSY